MAIFASEAALVTLAQEELRERIRKALTSQKRPTVTVLSSLLAAHDELGYLPDEAIEEVADFTDASINDAWGVATFYTNFRFSPRPSTPSRCAGARPATWQGRPASSSSY